jgi:hypothetical protein
MTISGSDNQDPWEREKNVKRFMGPADVCSYAIDSQTKPYSFSKYPVFYTPERALPMFGLTLKWRIVYEMTSWYEYWL